MPNRVYLVGAGPGDPDLLTVKALRLLQSADAVVYDRLISPEILELIPKGVSKIYVGKADGRHSLPQAEINNLLVNLACKNRRIVRLKGGDPFMFGRGSEEALCLQRHGIQFEIIPGITSASACASYAGVPLTHRGLARRVQFITGHHKNGEVLDIDARGLDDPEATLVIYMGLGHLVEICESLIAAGLPASTPAMAVHNGTTKEQQQIVSDLRHLPGMVTAAQLRSPVLIVIGKTVSLSRKLDWFHPHKEQNDASLDLGVGT